MGPLMPTSSIEEMISQNQQVWHEQLHTIFTILNENQFLLDEFAQLRFLRALGTFSRAFFAELKKISLAIEADDIQNALATLIEKVKPQHRLSNTRIDFLSSLSNGICDIGSYPNTPVYFQPVNNALTIIEDKISASYDKQHYYGLMSVATALISAENEKRQPAQQYKPNVNRTNQILFLKYLHQRMQGIVKTELDKEAEQTIQRFYDFGKKVQTYLTSVVPYTLTKPVSIINYNEVNKITVLPVKPPAPGKTLKAAATGSGLVSAGTLIAGLVLVALVIVNPAIAPAAAPLIPLLLVTSAVSLLVNRIASKRIQQQQEKIAQFKQDKAKTKAQAKGKAHQGEFEKTLSDIEDLMVFEKIPENLRQEIRKLTAQAAETHSKDKLLVLKERLEKYRETCDDSLAGFFKEIEKRNIIGPVIQQNVTTDIDSQENQPEEQQTVQGP